MEAPERGNSRRAWIESCALWDAQASLARGACLRFERQQSEQLCEIGGRRSGDLQLTAVQRVRQ